MNRSLHFKCVGIFLLGLCLVTGFQNCSGLSASDSTDGIDSAADGIDDGIKDLSARMVQAANCQFNGQLLAPTAKITAYQSATVPAGHSCAMQVRTCGQNGRLSGSYTFSSCTVDVIANGPCAFNGQNIASGSSVTAFLVETLPAGGTCDSQIRACNNGALSGSYSFSKCTVAPPAPPLAHTQKFSLDINHLKTITQTTSNSVWTYNAYTPYQFVIPVYKTLKVKLWGAGGGGNLIAGPSFFANLKAEPGHTASTLVSGRTYVFDGLGGVGTGGNINLNGGNGSVNHGGSSPNGGAAGVYNPGGVSVAAGIGGGSCFGGGGGAYVERTYHAGELAPGSTVDLGVGLKGSSATAPNIKNAICSEGGAGEVDIEWN